MRLDGQTQVAARQQMVDRFNDRTSDLCKFDVERSKEFMNIHITFVKSFETTNRRENLFYTLIYYLVNIFCDGENELINSYQTSEYSYS